MNERIKELAKLARYYSLYEKHSLQEIHKREITPIEYQDIYDKKFADLIIRECAGITDSLSKLYPRTDVSFDVGYTMGTARASKEIKQHFGVKE